MSGPKCVSEWGNVVRLVELGVWDKIIVVGGAVGT
jgi:hypothetical protein